MSIAVANSLGGTIRGNLLSPLEIAEHILPKTIGALSNTKEPDIMNAWLRSLIVQIQVIGIDILINTVSTI